MSQSFSSLERSGLARVASRAVDSCLFGLAFVLPLFFCTWTVDGLELPKQTLLVIVAVLMGMMWIGTGLLEKRVSLSKTGMHYAVAGFGIVSLAASALSLSRYQGLMGSTGELGAGFVSVVAFLLVYVVAANRIKRVGQVYDLLLSVLGSSLIVAILSLARLFGWAWMPSLGTGMTTVGNVFGTSVFLTASAVLAAGVMFHGCREKVCLMGSAKPIGLAARGIVGLSLLSSLLYLLMIDFWVAWVGLMVGSIVMVAGGLWRRRDIWQSWQMAIPAALMVLALIFLVKPFPYSIAVPGELTPSAMATWLIAKSTLQAHPVLGSGVGTWMADYARYHSPAVNMSPYWQMKFDHGFSLFLTQLATTGLMGALAWLGVIGTGLVLSVRQLLREREADHGIAFLTVFAGWVTVALFSFVYPIGIATQFLFWVLLGTLAAMMARTDWVLNQKMQSTVTGIWMLKLLAGLVLVWWMGQRFAAEVVFARSIQEYKSQQPIGTVIKSLERAMSMNRFVDVYPRNLAQAYLIQIGQVMNKRPTPAEIEQQVQPLLKRMTALAKLATQLEPVQADNWANAGQVQVAVMSLARDADQEAVRNYVEARRLEPSQPVYASELGKLYLLRADAYQPMTEVKDAKQKQQATEQMNASLEEARKSLTAAVQLKPDYFPARYFLGMVYERQGKVKEAIAQLEGVIVASPKDVAVGFELAILYYRDQQKDKALKLMEEVARADPNRANAHWYLATMYAERGRFDEAIVQLEALMKLTPENEAVKQQLEALKQNRKAPKAAGLPEPLKDL